MNRRSALISFSLIVGLVLSALALSQWIAPTSGAYLSWEATAGPNKVKIGGVGAEWTASTSTAETELEPTAQVEPEKDETPQPGMILETEIEITIEGNGLYDAVNSAYAVSGEACARNTGQNPTQGLSQLRVQVQESGTSTELGFGDELAPGEKKCVPYQMTFDGRGGNEYTLQGSITINNYRGWLPGGENCKQSSPCPHGPAAVIVFSLPAVTDEPTAVPPMEETPAVQPTEAPVVEAVVVPVIEPVMETTPEAPVIPVEPEETVTEITGEATQEATEEAVEEATEEATEETPAEEPTSAQEKANPEAKG